MAECFKCGISDSKTYLMDAITKEGIQKICRKCSFSEEIPIIKEPSLKRLEESEKKQSVYERMSRVAGIRETDLRERTLPTKQDENLRKIVDKNLQENFQKAKSHDDLIENFHWTIMRVRRSQKITIEQLAEKIHESSTVLKLAEKGVLPQDYLGLIKKLEAFLDVRLIKPKFDESSSEKKIEVVDAEVLGKPEDLFEKANTGNLTVEDIKRMKEKHEQKLMESDFENEKNLMFNENVKNNEDDFEFVKNEEELFNEFKEEISVPAEDASFERYVSREEKAREKERSSLQKAAKDRDLTKDEMDRILFGK